MSNSIQNFGEFVPTYRNGVYILTDSDSEKIFKKLKPVDQSLINQTIMNLKIRPNHQHPIEGLQLSDRSIDLYVLRDADCTSMFKFIISVVKTDEQPRW
jgi:hypothetical protein